MAPNFTVLQFHHITGLSFHSKYIGAVLEYDYVWPENATGLHH